MAIQIILFVLGFLCALLGIYDNNDSRGWRHLVWAIVLVALAVIFAFM